MADGLQVPGAISGLQQADIVDVEKLPDAAETAVEPGRLHAARRPDEVSRDRRQERLELQAIRKIDGTTPPERLPVFGRDGSILPPTREED